ncbi:MAG: STAS/SEC14 domain-containing protein [Anaerolineae bacterium]
MFTMMDRSTEDCLGVEVSGMVRAEDYEKIKPVLANAIKAHGTISLVVYVKDFEGLGGMDALHEDLRLAFNEYKDIAKVAIVGDDRWQEWAAKLLSALTPGTQERYFEPEQMDEAWTWACGVGWAEG